VAVFPTLKDGGLAVEPGRLAEDLEVALEEYD
jgi:hypothetical protein